MEKRIDINKLNIVLRPLLKSNWVIKNNLLISKFFQIYKHLGPDEPYCCLLFNFPKFQIDISFRVELRRTKLIFHI